MSKHRPSRFITQKAMSAIKHDAEIRNSRVKRGEIVEADGGRHIISRCGCGIIECAAHIKAPHNPYPNSTYAYY